MSAETPVNFGDMADDDSELSSTHSDVTPVNSGDMTADDGDVGLPVCSSNDYSYCAQPTQHGDSPSLLVGLAYNPLTGRLIVDVLKGLNFYNMKTQKAPDTYVKLALIGTNRQELAAYKTAILPAEANPTYKQTFMFKVKSFLMSDITVMFCVYIKRSGIRRKQLIGWFTSGVNSSGEEELSHWKDMVDSKGEQVCRWHLLLEP